MQEVFFSAEELVVHQGQNRPGIGAEVAEVEVDVARVKVLIARVDKVLVMVIS